MTVTVPPYMHMHLHSLVKQGLPFAMTVLLEGSHVPVVFGTQGCGVRTPSAAAVADATAGFARLLHIPKLWMLTMPLPSVKVPTGFPFISTVKAFVALNVDGIVPKEHFRVAPVVTNCDILSSSPYSSRTSLRL